MWNRVDPSRHEMVPRYKHAIKHEMRLVLLAKLLLSELRVLITDASLQCPGQPGGLRRVRTIRTWWRNFLRDTPMGIRMQRTADWPFEQSSLSTVWRVQVWKGWNAFILTSPAQTPKSQKLSHYFISFRMRNLDESTLLVMDSEWDTATSAMFATTSCHHCGFAALCDLFAFLPTSCIGEWLPKDAKSRCLFKYDFTCRVWELQDSWLQSQKLGHRRRSGSFSAKMYGSTECLGVLVV